MIILILNKTDISSSIKYFKDVNIYYCFVFLLTLILGFILRAIRWQLICSNKVIFFNSLKSILVGYSANNVLPFRAGEIIRIVYFSKKENVSKSYVTSSLVSEKILDFISILVLLLSLMLPFGLVASDLVKDYFFIIVVLAGAFLLVLGFLSRWSENITNCINNSRLSGKWIFKKIAVFIESFKFLKRRRNFIYILLLGFLIWLLEALLFYWIIISMEFKIYPFSAAIASMGFVAFGILIPSAPAYIGLFQGMVIIALNSYGYQNEESLAIGILVHICQLIPVTLSGLFIYFLEARKVVTNQKITNNCES